MIEAAADDSSIDWGPLRLPEGIRIGRAASRMVVEWVRIGRLVASANGEGATFTPFADVNPRVLQKFRATELIACERYLLGKLSLHGSAVRLPAGTLALLGESGAGKSTTAMALVSRFGGEFLADDIVPVDWRDGVPCTSPVNDDLWLTQETAAHFGLAAHDEWKVPCPPRARASSVERLSAIVQLIFDDTVSGVFLESLSGGEKFLVLSRAQVCYSTHADDETVRNLAARAELARRTPVFRLRRGRSLHTLDAVEKALQDCLRAGREDGCT